MERKFTDENFEGFLRQNADHLRMTPADKVWKNISRSLNHGRRRFTISLLSFLLLGSLLGYFIIEESSNKFVSPTIKPSNKTTNTKVSKRTVIESQNQSSSIQKTQVNIEQTVQPTSGINFKNETGVLLPDNTEIQKENIVAEPVAFNGTIIDSDISQEEQIPPTASTELMVNNAEFPYTIESVLNSYRARKKSKVGIQLYFTPTISYRKLSDNNSYLRSASGNFPVNYPFLQDINDAVTHKPDMGFELGFTAKYPMAKNLKLRSGLQFNISRYGIKAFKSSLQVATIQLNGSAPVTNITNQNNVTGYSSNWLQNFYVQVSAPVGLEYKLKGDEKVQFGVASTIQPTYVLGDRAYLITADHKNYMEVPWLSRKWNVATSLETFVGYSTGRLKWQVGPQVRYQLLSSFISKYPVKENLFDFGMKVGVSLNNQ